MDRQEFFSKLKADYPDIFNTIGIIHHNDDGAFMVNVNWYKDLCILIGKRANHNDYIELWGHIKDNEDLHWFWLL